MWNNTQLTNKNWVILTIKAKYLGNSPTSLKKEKSTKMTVCANESEHILKVLVEVLVDLSMTIPIYESNLNTKLQIQNKIRSVWKVFTDIIASLPSIILGYLKLGKKCSILVDLRFS